MSGAADNPNTEARAFLERFTKLTEEQKRRAIEYIDKLLEKEGKA